MFRYEPVRLYAVATAIMGVVAHYAPDIPSALWLAIVGAVLGTGEVVRAKVVPVADAMEITDMNMDDLIQIVTDLQDENGG